MAFITRHVWLVLGGALALGVLLPGPGRDLGWLIVPLMMVAFFFACLGMDAAEVLQQLRRPRLLVVACAVLMLIVPALLYVLIAPIDGDIALVVLLLAAMPPGMAAPALTDALGGRTSLSVALNLVSLIASPLTVVVLFAVLTSRTLTLDLWDLATLLVVMNLVPLAAGQVVRRLAPRWIENTKHLYPAFGLLAISGVVYVATAGQVDEMLANPAKVFTALCWLYGLFLVLQVVGYALGFRRTKQDRVALAVSAAYMNNGLAIGLAAAFFGPHIVLLTTLSEIPWSTTVGPFQWVLRRLR